MVVLDLFVFGQVSHKSVEFCEVDNEGLVLLVELEHFAGGRACPVRVVVSLSESVEEGIEAFDIDILSFFVDYVEDLLKGVSFQAIESVAESKLFVRESHFLSIELVLELHDPGTEFI